MWTCVDQITRTRVYKLLRNKIRIILIWESLAGAPPENKSCKVPPKAQAKRTITDSQVTFLDKSAESQTMKVSHSIKCCNIKISTLIVTILKLFRYQHHTITSNSLQFFLSKKKKKRLQFWISLYHDVEPSMRGNDHQMLKWLCRTIRSPSILNNGILSDYPNFKHYLLQSHQMEHKLKRRPLKKEFKIKMKQVKEHKFNQAKNLYFFFFHYKGKLPKHLFAWDKDL